MNDLIEIREIGDYRIKVYYDGNAECPCASEDMVWGFLWEQGGVHILSDSCDWESVFGEFGYPAYSLREGIIQLIEDYVDWGDLVQYFKDGKVRNYSLRTIKGVWFLLYYDVKRDTYLEIDMYGYGELTQNMACHDDLVKSLHKNELIQILNDLGRDIVATEWNFSGCCQGGYTESIAFCTKDRFEQMVSKNDNWKENAWKCFQDSAKSIDMWMQGDVKGFTLERKVSFTKVYDDPNREDEADYDWEEIDSCWGYYMSTDELINEVISEHCLTENA